MLKNKLYLGAEVYYMNVGFTKDKKISSHIITWAAMYKVVTSLPPSASLAARYDFFNRNGMDTNGFLNMPAVGMNYFFQEL